MAVIWKFPVNLRDGGMTLNLPQLFRPLCVQVQDDFPMLWALVDPRAQTETRRFRVIGTGHDFVADGWHYVGTWQDGAFVWHLFGPEPTL